jgi:hypothetical protein
MWPACCLFICYLNSAFGGETRAAGLIADKRRRRKKNVENNLHLIFDLEDEDRR